MLTDRSWFTIAVALYGISAVYSVLLWRRGFREDNRVLYALLAGGAVLHTWAMFQRGFALDRCPINNLFEASMFIAWTIVAAYLVIGAFRRLRFLGAFASPLLAAIGVFALFPMLDHRGPKPEFSHAWESLHAASVLLAYGAFGLSAVAALMYLTQEHDLKFHRARAVLALVPPIQRLEKVISGLLAAGFVLLTAGLSFIGAGVRAPTPEWGSMIAMGFQNVITGQWWPSLFPGAALALTVLGFGLVGGSIEAYSDPRERTRPSRKAWRAFVRTCVIGRHADSRA